jgi:hypothetical protein
MQVDDKHYITPFPVPMIIGDVKNKGTNKTWNMDVDELMR